MTLHFTHHAQEMSSSLVMGEFDTYDGTFTGTVRLGGGYHVSAREGRYMGQVSIPVSELVDLMVRHSREWRAFNAESARFAERFGVGLTVDAKALRRRVEDALRKRASLGTLFEVAEMLQVSTS